MYHPVTEQTVLRIHVPDGTETQTLRGEGGASHSISLAPDSTRTATVTKWPDGTIEQRGGDGAGTVSTLTTRPDGTWAKSTQLPDGGTREEDFTSDGRITVLQKGSGGLPSTWVDRHRGGWRYGVRTAPTGPDPSARRSRTAPTGRSPRPG